jgi:hypothetical protein
MLNLFIQQTQLTQKKYICIIQNHTYMKEKLLTALKAKFVGVSDNILARIANKLAKTITSEEQVATAVEGVTFQQVLDSYGDSRATEASQTAVRNYEAKYGLKEGAKIEKEGANQEPNSELIIEGDNDKTPEWAKLIIASNKELQEKIALMEGEQVTKTRQQQLDQVLEKLPDYMRGGYKRMSLTNLTDEEFTNTLQEVSTEVEGIVKGLGAKGAVMGAPLIGNERKQDEELTEEQLSAINQRENNPNGDGQPF